MERLRSEISSVPPPRRHLGVYGLVVDAGHLLTVRKARGPYTGMLDLPGGSPNPGETRETTLTREMLEETGGSCTRISAWSHFDLMVEQDSSGQPIQLRHVGYFCQVTLSTANFDMLPLEDVAGLEWLDLAEADERSDLSTPLAYVVMVLRDSGTTPSVLGCNYDNPMQSGNLCKQEGEG